MDRWMRWKTAFQESENSPGEAGSGGAGEEDLETQDQNSGEPRTGIETGFKSDLLKGKSPEEIERLVTMYEETIREQGRELNRKGQQGTPHATPQGPPEPEPEPEIDATEFWQDPVKYMRADREKTVKEVRKQLEEIISPFKQNLAETQEQQVWNQFLSKHPDGSKYRSLIEEGLRQSGIEDPAIGTIETIYYSIKGRLADAGKTIEEVTGGEPGGNKQTKAPKNDPPMNPQHRPSSHPTKSRETNDGPSRELTENEKKMARERWSNLPAKEAYKRFIAWQEADETEIIGSKIGKEG